MTLMATIVFGMKFMMIRDARIMEVDLGNTVQRMIIVVIARAMKPLPQLLRRHLTYVKTLLAGKTKMVENAKSMSETMTHNVQTLGTCLLARWVWRTTTAVTAKILGKLV
jgi:hypothetical protein